MKMEQVNNWEFKFEVRDRLNPDVILTLFRNREGDEKEKYRIVCVKAEDSFSICYEAEHIGSKKRGLLKEFYPIYADQTGAFFSVFERTENVLLVKNRLMQEAERICEEFVSRYTRLKKEEKDKPEYAMLNYNTKNMKVVYAKEIEIEKGNRSRSKMMKQGTVYIWEEYPDGRTMQEYLNEACKDADREPEKKLSQLLKAVITVSELQKNLIKEGLFMLDIAPAHLFLNVEKGEIVKLIPCGTDVLHRASGETLYSLGTQDVMVPESYAGRADYRSAIYAIGALLYQSVVVTEENTIGRYEDDLYDVIPQTVRHSKRIACSVPNSNIRLMSGIVRVLQRSLAKNPEERYQKIEELLEELRYVEARCSQFIKIQTDKTGEALRTDPEIVMQKLLYDRPLYRMIPYGLKELYVLIIGSGTFGQEFLDICLEAGQMQNCILHAVCLSDCPNEDRECYMLFRPAMGEFVDIDGSMKNSGQIPYGYVHFGSVGTENGRNLKFESVESGAYMNERLVEQILDDAIAEGKTFQNIFVALGDQALNEEVAEQFAQSLKNKHISCPVNFVTEEQPDEKMKEGPAFPVWMNEPIIPETINQKLEQIAFNTHMAYRNSLNGDLLKAYIAFKDNMYSYRSSMDYALSLRYKLYSIGILFQNDLPEGKNVPEGIVVVQDELEAAQAFSERILEKKEDPKARDQFDTLVMLEHSRWILNNASEGWRAPRDQEGNLLVEEIAALGRTKNKRKWQHLCMVRSGKERPLSSNTFKENRHGQWNQLTHLETLDELDQASLKMHQYYACLADKLIEENPMQNGPIKKLEKCIRYGGENTVRAFEQFRFCLKNILHGVRSYARQFENYQSVFLDALNRESEETGVHARMLMDEVTRQFYPAVEANRYASFKEHDEELTGKIPFLLTYHVRESMAAVFEDGLYQNGRNEAAFANVASATVLCPKRILYLYRLDWDVDVENLRSKTVGVLRYLCGRSIHCDVEFIVLYSELLSEEKKKTVYQHFQMLLHQKPEGNAVLKRARMIECKNSAEMIEKGVSAVCESGISLFDGTNGLFESVIENGRFVASVRKMKIPYFEFDWREKKFTCAEDCGYLQFIRNDSSLRIQDMFALMNAKDVKFNLPEFSEEYDQLWEIYTRGGHSDEDFDNGIMNWNHMCIALKRYDEERHAYASIPISCQAYSRKIRLTKALPQETAETAENLLKVFIENGVAGCESFVDRQGEECQVVLYIAPEDKINFERIFERPEFLTSGFSMTAKKNWETGAVEVQYNALKVEEAELDRLSWNKGYYIQSILDQMERNGYIHNLYWHNRERHICSFEYASEKMKSVMTKAGEILEVCAYYKVLETGYFDDVACGYEFCWEDSEIKNELDLVLTKGFRSMIVECKAVRELKQDFYEKLYSLAERFGIGTVKVLINNTYRNSGISGQLNGIQTSRGIQMRIQTISDREELKEIGRTFKEIMKKQRP